MREADGQGNSMCVDFSEGNYMSGIKVLDFPYIFALTMSDEKAIYWLTQVSGWFGYILLILFHNLTTGVEVEVGIIKVLFMTFVLGITVSHLMRAVILWRGLLSIQLLRVIPRILLLSIAAGLLSALLYSIVSDLFFTDISPILVWPFELFLQLFFPFTTIFLFWNILYFAAIYLKNYEREEIKNLRLNASINEIELGNLRSQLNPHFIFNALNSIRALIDEDPQIAKKAITRMSRILRSSLMAGRRKLVPLKEEIELVKDYLALEKIRYEERLEYQIDIAQELLDALVPPIMLQTLVENAIKHGISHLPKGGRIKVQAEQRRDQLRLMVINTGTYKSRNSEKDKDTAVGLENSARRLQLLFGSKSQLTIDNKEGEVHCEVFFPLINDISKLNENTTYR
jgi:two-component system, LytTR family, sensor kinase